MFPMDFEEFLWALGVSEPLIDKLRDCYKNCELVPNPIHTATMDNLAKYFIVGGMPEAVTAFLRTSDITQVSEVQASILAGYRLDISKYAGTDQPLVKAIFDSIPSQLSKEDKKFVLASMEKGASYRKYGNAIEWIIDAGIAYPSYNLSAFELPFPLHEKRNLFKLFFLDNGLLSHLCLTDLKFDVLQGEVNINQGALAENFVATELTAHGHSLNYYDKKSRQELDFVYPLRGKVQIIEVKSGKDYHRHASLDAAIQQYESLISIPIVLIPSNTECSPEIRYQPLYMAMFL